MTKVHFKSLGGKVDYSTHHIRLKNKVESLSPTNWESQHHVDKIVNI